jgi:hypothetical protein
MFYSATFPIAKSLTHRPFRGELNVESPFAFYQEWQSALHTTNCWLNSSVILRKLFSSTLQRAKHQGHIPNSHQQGKIHERTTRKTAQETQISNRLRISEIYNVKYYNAEVSINFSHNFGSNFNVNLNFNFNFDFKVKGLIFLSRMTM